MATELSKRTIPIDNLQWAQLLFGPQNHHLNIFERELSVKTNTRGNQLMIEGQEAAVQLMVHIITELEYLHHAGYSLTAMDILNAIRMGQMDKLDHLLEMYEDKVITDNDGRVIHPRNYGQQQYVKAIRKNPIVFGVGPAGTGKTFLAVAMAVAEMKKGGVKRVILTRPAVEAGESLGFLPGDLKEKVDPYLRPLYDALHTLLGSEQLERLMDRETIEIAPLAYMRGRTLEDAFIILDEAQNTTVPQMKMFLTRLGFNSKMVINGDKTQIDLPKGVTSGLSHASKILTNIAGIEHIQFSSADVVRHPLVAAIIDAYGAEQKENIEKDHL
ncbi:PhoH family protein [Allofustis seminis]|uniref:PhoH family protein n=1 Tax=Allofustis seminis TaxID=166939 RepID=UPI000382EE6D|nr:PhoH family protein [Allofustis seminis]